MKSSRLLIYNYSMSKTSQVFAHQATLAEKISLNFTRTSVLTSDSDDLQINDPKGKLKIQSINWRHNQSVTNILKFYYYTFRFIFLFRPTHVFYHMTDVHAALAAPIFKMLGTRQVLWYAHANGSLFLRIAMNFVNCVVTSTPRSFPNWKPSVTCIGQAVDINMFSFTSKEFSKPPKLIHVGRLDKSKNIDDILSWARDSIRRRESCDLTLIGEPTLENIEYWASLEQKYYKEFELGLFNWIPSTPRRELPEKLRKFDVFVHAYRGSLDKAVLEATALGLTVISINKEYIKEFGCWSTDVPSLRSEFASLIKCDKRNIMENNFGRRRRVEQNHSKDNWVMSMTRLIYGNIRLK